MIRSKLISMAIHYSLQLFIIECMLFTGFLLLAPSVAQKPSIVSASVTSTFYLINGLVWYWVASRHRDYLVSFFSGTFGFRFLLALIVMAIYYVMTDKSATITFFWVFAIYYLVTLIHFSIFFSKASNRI